MTHAKRSGFRSVADTLVMSYQVSRERYGRLIHFKCARDSRENLTVKHVDVQRFDYLSGSSFRITFSRHLKWNRNTGPITHQWRKVLQSVPSTEIFKGFHLIVETADRYF